MALKTMSLNGYVYKLKMSLAELKGGMSVVPLGVLVLTELKFGHCSNFLPELANSEIFLSSF